MKIIADNKKARFDYHIVETFEAGLVLTGSEVKSLRAGNCSLKDSYVAFMGNEAFLLKSHIAPYTASSYNNHEPERRRKLLLHRHELLKLRAAVEEKGSTCVPLKIYFQKGLVKVEIALAKGKTKGDQRQSIKKRDASREMAQALRRTRR